MLFREVFEVVNARAGAGDPAMLIKGVAYDSRHVAPGFLFVAIGGLKTDSHEYIDEVIERGAAAVIMQRPVSVPAGTAWVLTDNSRLALALVSARFYGNPSEKMKLIGITGTNGKTTTSNLVAAIFQGAGLKCGLVGTIHNRIGRRLLPVKHTTPESPDLQRLLAEMRSAGVQVCVMEVSSHALALSRVDGCRFDTAIFTNLTQDHLDFHERMEDYLAAKLRLFGGLTGGANKGAGICVINADDQRGADFLEASGGIVCTYGINSPADVRAENITVGAAGASFIVRGKWGDCPLNLKITGLFNVYNALAAFTAAAAMGVPVAVIKNALEDIRGIPGRFEQVEAGQDFMIIVDYAHTPDGLENILKTARQLTKARLITLFGCGGDRDRKKRPLMGAIAAGYSDLAVITSDNPRSEDPMKIISEIEEGVRQVVGKDKYVVEPDRRKAIGAALSLAKPGDAVVIAGKGHEDYQIIGAEKFPFDDRQEAKAALEELKRGLL